MTAHLVDVETLDASIRTALAAFGGARLGRYRWRCSCGLRGLWMRHARSARNGGAKHVAAMERGERRGRAGT